MAVADIDNLIAVGDNVATAGQPTAEQFRAARQEGYGVVVNLAPDGLDTSLAGEAALLRDLGLEYHHLPVPWGEPDLVRLEAFERIMDAAGSRRTLTHCQANYRVTAFFAMYAEARLGWSAERGDAPIERVWAARPDFRMDEVWQGFIRAARSRAPRA